MHGSCVVILIEHWALSHINFPFKQLCGRHLSISLLEKLLSSEEKWAWRLKCLSTKLMFVSLLLTRYKKQVSLIHDIMQNKFQSAFLVESSLFQTKYSRCALNDLSGYKMQSVHFCFEITRDKSLDLVLTESHFNAPTASSFKRPGDPP